MTENDKFLDAYRQLEDALSHSTKLSADTVLSYESALQAQNDTESSEKLKVCRIMRNYMTHHADGKSFLSATPAMTKFIKHEANKISSLELNAGNLAKKTAILTPSTTMKEAAAAFSKSKTAWLPYADKKGNIVGAVDSSLVITLCAQGTRSNATIGSYAKPSAVPVIDSNTIAYNLPQHANLIVINQKTGTFKGIIAA